VSQAAFSAFAKSPRLATSKAATRSLHSSATAYVLVWLTSLPPRCRVPATGWHVPGMIYEVTLRGAATHCGNGPGSPMRGGGS